MHTYYFELDVGVGGPYKFQAESDTEAVEHLKGRKNLLILYRESDTEDGTPFVTLWEKGEEHV